MRISTVTSRSFLAGMKLLILAVLLIGCGTPGGAQINLIQGVTAVQPIPAINTPVGVVVNGSGKCREMEINWGDGSRNTAQGVDLSLSPTYTHTYVGWGGGKTVTVAGKIGCEGTVNTRFTMEPIVYSLGFNQVQKPTAQTCNQVPNFPGVSSHNLVYITTVPVTGYGIDFGCPFQGCRYDADGKPGSAADSSFPFPGLKEYSLVLRVSSQVVQGGTNMSFTTTDAGSLEICLNDTDMSNNTGGYMVNISVDQLGPTPVP
jgi:hypothetical protein